MSNRNDFYGTNEQEKCKHPFQDKISYDKHPGLRCHYYFLHEDQRADTNRSDQWYVC